MASNRPGLVFLQQGWEVAKFTLRSFMEDRCWERAAALTFTTLFAVVPIMTVAFSVVAVLPGHAVWGVQLQSFIFSNFLPSTGLTLESHLHEFAQHAERLTVLGLLMLLITAIMMLVSVEQAFNRIWRVRRGRPGLTGFLRYWAVLSLGPVLLGLGLALSSYLATNQMVSHAASLVTSLLPGLVIVPFLCSTAALVLIYITVPHCHVPWKSAWVGGLCAAFFFETAKNLFAVLMSHFSSYTIIYGAFAAFPLFLIWIDVSWIIVLAGVELTRVLATWSGHTSPRHPPCILFFILLRHLYILQGRGETLPETKGMELVGVSHEADWMVLVDVLLAQHMVVRTEDGDYVLCRHIDHIPLWSWLRLLPWPWPKAEDLAAVQQPWADHLQVMLQTMEVQGSQWMPMTLGQLLETSS